MRRAADFRMSRGFVVPIHGLTGYEAGVSLAGVNLDLNARSKPALHLIAMYGFDHIRRLLAPAPHPSARLTPREREVLELMSRGKSNKDIAAELVLSAAAVAKHVSNIFTKLRLDPSEDNRRVKAILEYLSAHR